VTPSLLFIYRPRCVFRSPLSLLLFTTLDEVVLDNNEITDHSLGLLPDLPNLRSLTLNKNKVYRNFLPKYTKITLLISHTKWILIDSMSVLIVFIIPKVVQELSPNRWDWLNSDKKSRHRRSNHHYHHQKTLSYEVRKRRYNSKESCMHYCVLHCFCWR